MALVLRNAILPRNIFSLKYFKNRSITTMMQKRKPVLLPMAISHRPMAMAIPKRYMKTGEVKRLLSVRHRDCQQKTSLRYSRSCPNLIPHAKVHTLFRHYSPCRTEPVGDEASTSVSPASHSDKPRAELGIALACKCPCPFPCGPCGNSCGCCCLPPPCNTPPKCIQYMTGYYYYPYGFWFCGPYHVSGCCCPVGACAKCPCPCPCPCP